MHKERRLSEGLETQMPGRREEPELQDRLLREVHRVAKIGTWEVTAEEELLWSDETLELFGVARSEFTGTIDEFFQLVHEEDVERVKRLDDFSNSKNDYFNSEYRIVRPDGALRHIRQTAIVLRDENGVPRGFSGVVQDVSEQVETEAKLRQAQKMETIGNLSGGVAHDFNNILAAIMGAAELLQHNETYEPDLIQSIISSAKRGGELTHRLLAFARKQPLRVMTVDVVASVQGIASMLDRLTGPDIRLDLELEADTWLIEADPAPLEEALVNLAVNARDAIVGAGTITLSCRNRCCGGGEDFVEIALRDTGMGMMDAVLDQAVDPFFTTKPVGKGSGLGLSMVDGFVRQSGGEMQIASEPGKGTIVSMLMPKSPGLAPCPAQSRGEVYQASAERVLIIEDNEDLARLLYHQLRGLNFQPAIATDRAAALRAADEDGGFDIVLTDIILADGERGPIVVEELRAAHPQMRPIFMTGFVPNDHGTLASAIADGKVLRKPFTLQELAAALRDELARGSQEVR